MPDPLPVTAGRVRLRRLRRDDLPRFQAYRLDPVVGRYQGWETASDEESGRFLEDMGAAPAFPPGEWFQLGIADCHSDLLIGDIGVCVSQDGSEAEIGFTLCRQSQGMGLAREAVGLAIGSVFSATAVNRIVAITDLRNAAANKLLLALGMRFTESRRTLFRGEPCSENLYELARPAAG